MGNGVGGKAKVVEAGFDGKIDSRRFCGADDGECLGGGKVDDVTAEGRIGALEVRDPSDGVDLEGLRT